MRKLIKHVRRFLPAALTRADLAAWRLGFNDGWNQPHYLNTSWNVDHLADPDGRGDVYESQDAGINAGQLIRSPFRHQRGA